MTNYDTDIADYMICSRGCGVFDCTQLLREDIIPLYNLGFGEYYPVCPDCGARMYPYIAEDPDFEKASISFFSQLCISTKEETA